MSLIERRFISIRERWFMSLRERRFISIRERWFMSLRERFITKRKEVYVCRRKEVYIGKRNEVYLQCRLRSWERRFVYLPTSYYLFYSLRFQKILLSPLTNVNTFDFMYRYYLQLLINNISKYASRCLVPLWVGVGIFFFLT